MDTSYSDSRYSLVQPPYGVWNQYPMNNLMNNEKFDPNSQSNPSQESQQPQQYQQAQLENARHSEDNQSNPSPYLTNSNSRIPSIIPSSNKGTSNIFYKTRMCARFRAGTCRNGGNCNFAHGIEDLRQPPPKWQELVGGAKEERDRSSSSSMVGSNNRDEDQKIIQRMKLCRKFCSGEECPYGERCNFLHEDPAKYREGSSERYRESSVISIGTTADVPPLGNGSNNQVGVSRPASMNMKPLYWKTALCTRFEVTGHCPVGDKCHYAHGQAELQNMGGRSEGEALNVTPLAPKPQAALPANDGSIMKTTLTTASPFDKEERKGTKCMFKWPKKTNRIYADWIDDLPLGQTNQEES